MFRGSGVLVVTSGSEQDGAEVRANAPPRLPSGRPLSNGYSGPRLRGRRRECEALDQLLDRVRAGCGEVLVLRGEPGIGKTALLHYLRERATSCRVAQVSGVESEMELDFASLHQLCAPMLERLKEVPGPQRDALRAAFGLSIGAAPDRFLVGLAVLTLLSEVATERPLICLVDDGQWLDRASLQVLGFVARRLLGDPVALVFALREHEDNSELMGLPALTVPGLCDDDARMILESALGGRLDERVRDRVISESRGNPLALLELPRGLSPAELAGGFGLPGERPLTTRIEQSFVRRLQMLPRDTRRLLLIAAAEPLGDLTLLWRAADQLGIGADAAAPAEDMGLIELRVRVRFRHPLVRSAAYRIASMSERQQVHRALAEATDPHVDSDRRAWHLAHAVAGLDEAIADELVQSAERARRRGGIAAAAAFLQRASELTADPARRAVRVLAAAQAKLDAGAPETASKLLAAAELSPLAEIQRAHVDLLRARIALARGRGRDAPPLLLTAAERLAPLDAGLARETYLEALEAVTFAGLRAGDGVLRAAARAVPPAPGSPRSIDLLLDGLATRFTEGYAAAVPLLRQALQAVSREDTLRWIVLAARTAPDLWDDEVWHELGTRAVRLAREAGALSLLPIADTIVATVHMHAGDFVSAAALLEEAEAITQAIGSPPLGYTWLLLAAFRGHQAKALGLIEATVRDATARGEGKGITIADYAAAVLNNGVGDYGAALAAAQRASAHDDLNIFGWALIELIEAGVRSGQPELAADALRRLMERTRASGTEWALGIQARSQAVLSQGPTTENLYREAIERLGRTRIVVHLARARLLFGEWLRRENRRLDAREQLRVAHATFSRIGAEAFAERARRELLATGETVPKPASRSLATLTAQEVQIARLAREGYTNPEIGAQLFLSPRTVEWHLRKVFTKLDISSRRHLAQALPDPVRVRSPG
jgi:DNA-binding CsgD family transcriptional regulator